MSAQATYGVTMTRGIEGQLADNSTFHAEPFYSEEASAEIAFGRAVKFGTNINGVLLPTAETDLIAGILMHSNEYTRGFDGADLGTTGVKPGAKMNVLRRGRILVKCKSVVVANVSRLWVRAVAGAPPEYLGGLEDADDSTDMIDCTAQGVFRESGAVDDLVILEVDFTREPT